MILWLEHPWRQEAMPSIDRTNRIQGGLPSLYPFGGTLMNTPHFLQDRFRIGTGISSIIRRVGWSAFGILTLACSKPSMVYNSPEFIKRRDSVKCVALLPAIVEITLGSSTEKAERQPEEEAKVASILMTQLQSALAERKLQVSLPPSPVVNSEPGKTSQEASTSSGENCFRVSVRMRIFKRTGGSNALETTWKTLVGLGTAGMFIPTKTPSGGASLVVTFQEAGSEKVLWTNTATDISFRLAGQSNFDVEKLLSQVLQPLQ